MKLKIAILAILMISPSAAIAQNCNALLANGIHNIQISKSSGAAIATAYFNHCHKRNSFQSMDEASLESIEIEAYGYGSGEAKRNRSKSERAAELIEWCETNASYAESSRNEYIESRQIYSAALDAFNSCVSLQSEGIHISPTISPDQRTVDISIRYAGGADRGPRFYGIAADGFVCEAQIPIEDGLAVFPSNEIPTDRTIFLSQSAISVHCTRPAGQKITISGDEYSITSRGTISVQDSDASAFQMFFSEKATPSIPRERADQLEQRISELESSLADIGSWQTSGIISVAADRCPTGWSDYRAGYGQFLRGIDKSGKTDPDGTRSNGSIQEDQFGSHTHSVSLDRTTKHAWTGGGSHFSAFNAAHPLHGADASTSIAGGSETRPTNVAVLFCVKN